MFPYWFFVNQHRWWTRRSHSPSHHQVSHATEGELRNRGTWHPHPTWYHRSSEWLAIHWDRSRLSWPSLRHPSGIGQCCVQSSSGGAESMTLNSSAVDSLIKWKGHPFPSLAELLGNAKGTFLHKYKWKTFIPTSKGKKTHSSKKDI